MLGEHVADFADSAVSIVGRHLHQNGRAARPIAFKRYFIDLAAFQFTRTTHDGALDVVGGHAGPFGVGNGFPQTGVGVHVASTRAGGQS